MIETNKPRGISKKNETHLIIVIISRSVAIWFIPYTVSKGRMDASVVDIIDNSESYQLYQMLLIFAQVGYRTILQA